MSKKTRYLFGILLTIVIGMILMWFYCCTITDEDTTESPNNQEVVVVEPAPTTNTGFTIKDPDPDGNFAYTSNDNFNFTTSNYAINTPVAQGVTNGIEVVKAHLTNNTRKSIDVTGLYTSSEDNTSAFPNLGIARANAIKNYLSNKGIPSTQINIFGKEDNTLVLSDSLFIDPVRYNISEGGGQEAQELEALKKRINDNPLILYFRNGQSSINPTVEQRQKIADISRYLDKVEGSSITIEGHTDNTGGRITNSTLGLKRANAIKQDFIKNGISEVKIITTSKGSDEPIASNETEEGKAKNRRSIVKIN